MQSISRSLSNAAREDANDELLLDRLEYVISALMRIDERLPQHYRESITILQRARVVLQETLEHDFRQGNAIINSAGDVGRPPFVIPERQLRFLVENGFTAMDISNMLNVSPRTIRRRLQQFGISIRHQYTSISDANLDRIVSDIFSDFPNCGYRRLDGFLRSKGYRVQQIRIRDCARRVDPNGVLLRSLEINVVRRRVYNVVAPLALWHIDGYHKLIR